jgi:hypothetical protein
MIRTALRRNRALKLVRAQLDRKGGPYFLLFIVLAATGLAGFLASVVLRWAGLHSMAVRYPVCVALAYLVFLFQLFLCVLYHRTHGAAGRVVRAAGADDVVDAAFYTAEVTDVLPDGGPAVAAAPAASSGSSAKGSGWLDGLGGGGGDDGAAVLVVIVIVALVVAALVGSLVVLFEAPALLAEVLVDGVLMAGMARRLRRANPHDWVFSVIGRTWLPALVVALVFAGGGALLGMLSPGATTMAEALSAQR